MLSPLALFLLAVAVLSALLYCIGVWAAWRHTSQALKTVPDQQLPPLTLLKPIKGLEEELEENLRSFFEQDYPAPVQIVFASTESVDPGIDLAKQVAARYPNADVSFVGSDLGFGLNPKVANMQGALLAARHDTVLQSDANVRLRPGFLKQLAGQFVAEQASLLGCLVVGVGERSAYAALENLQLTAYISPGMCGALKLGNTTCVVGKTILFHKSELEELGGLEMVKDILLEDFVLGETYKNAGKNVVLSSLTIENVNIRAPLKRFLNRHSRWLMMTAIVSTLGFIGQLLSNPLPLALLAWAASSFDPRLGSALAALVVLKVLCDAWLVRRMRGHGMRPLYWLLSPARDLAHAAMWIYACFSRTTEWRGRRFRLGERTRIFPLSATR